MRAVLVMLAGLRWAGDDIIRHREKGVPFLPTSRFTARVSDTGLGAGCRPIAGSLRWSPWFGVFVCRSR